jgi:hypothetical protein
MRRNGIYLSSLDTIKARFAAQIASGTFTQEIAARLFADSPYQSDQLEFRKNRFWLVSHPLSINDSGVELLLESWGGESAYFWQRDPALQAMLKRIGRPRVLEIAVPLSHSRHALSATEAVIATYSRHLGVGPTAAYSTSISIFHLAPSIFWPYIRKANQASQRWLEAIPSLTAR